MFVTHKAGLRMNWCPNSALNTAHGTATAVTPETVAVQVNNDVGPAYMVKGPAGLDITLHSANLRLDEADLAAASRLPRDATNHVVSLLPTHTHTHTYLLAHMWTHTPAHPGSPTHAHSHVTPEQPTFLTG